MDLIGAAGLSFTAAAQTFFLPAFCNPTGRESSYHPRPMSQTAVSRETGPAIRAMLVVAGETFIHTRAIITFLEITKELLQNLQFP
jgi:hypothetical protein